MVICSEKTVEIRIEREYGSNKVHVHTDGEYRVETLPEYNDLFHTILKAPEEDHTIGLAWEGRDNAIEYLRA